MEYVKNAQEYYDWKKNRKSRLCVYHDGHLQQDRWRQKPGGRKDSVEPIEIVHGLANIVYQDYEEGNVSLFQKRLGDNRFEYLAVKGRF